MTCFFCWYRRTYSMDKYWWRGNMGYQSVYRSWYKRKGSYDWLRRCSSLGGFWLAVWPIKEVLALGRSKIKQKKQAFSICVYASVYDWPIYHCVYYNTFIEWPVIWAHFRYCLYFSYLLRLLHSWTKIECISVSTYLCSKRTFIFSPKNKRV